MNASTEKKRVKSQEKHYVDIPCFCNTLCADDEHVHCFDCEKWENMKKEEKFHLARVLVVYDSYNAWVMGSFHYGGGFKICELDWCSIKTWGWWGAWGV